MTIFFQKPYVLQSELDYDKKQSFCINVTLKCLCFFCGILSVSHVNVEVEDECCCTDLK